MKAYLDDEKKYEIFIEILLATRLLIQAKSGGGKSHAIRRIIEQIFGMVQVIVIDPEGEYSTLREKYDMIICAPSGADAVATPKTAKVLARKLLESNVSAVLDIYELKAHERQEFVRKFLEAVVNIPKKLWHPVMIILDEAHVYAPEKGKATSTAAVIDIATRGRKRGQCLLAATQRLSKLHKDVAAELGNKFIGATGLDVDIKRAADELGLTVKEAWRVLRDRKPGEFFIYGPAFTNSIEMVKIGSVITTHGSDQDLQALPPAPSKKIKKILEGLEDLPVQAEEEARTLSDMRIQLRTANQEINTLKRTTGVTEIEVRKRVKEAEVVGYNNGASSVRPENPEHVKLISKVKAGVDRLADVLSEFDGQPVKMIAKKSVPKISSFVNEIIPDKTFRAPQTENVVPEYLGEISLGEGGMLRMLKTLASMYPQGYTKSQMALLSKMSPKSGTFGTYLGGLRTYGFLRVEGSGRNAIYYTTEEGLEYLGADVPDAPIDHEEAMKQWGAKLPAGCFKMLKIIVEAGPEGIHREEMAIAAEMSATSGTFGTYMGYIRRNELATENGEKIWVANDILFPERSI